MLRLLDHVSGVYAPRYYIMADTDRMSEEKVTEFEKRETQGNKPKVARKAFNVQQKSDNNLRTSFHDVN